MFVLFGQYSKGKRITEGPFNIFSLNMDPLRPQKKTNKQTNKQTNKVCITQIIAINFM